jgi:hypothetical protein
VAGRPPGPHTVGEIARDLGQSAGAVGNALTTLADLAEAARITGKPLRYEANSATAAVANAITPKAPSAPKAPAPAQGRLRRAEVGRLVRTEGFRPAGKACPVGCGCGTRWPPTRSAPPE